MDLLDKLLEMTGLFTRTSSGIMFTGTSKELAKQLFEIDSIAKKSKQAIFQFPILTSENVTLETLTMIMKALEREYTSFIKIATGLEGIIADGNFNSKKWLEKMHQNSDSSEVLNLNYNTPSKIGSYVDFVTESSNPLGLNMNIIGQKSLLSEAKSKSTTPLTDFQKHQVAKDIRDERAKRAETRYQHDRDKLDDLRNFNKFKYQQKRDAIQDIKDAQRRKDQVNLEILKQNMQARTDNLHVSNRAALVDNDVKKANELIPTLMDITLKFVQPQGGPPIEQTFTIGVKTIAHLIPSESMITNIYTTIKEKRTFLNFIRFTTGEISFFKDFVANINEMKRRALSKRVDSKWWEVLRKRTMQNKTLGRIFSSKKLLPNAALLVSIDEIEYITNTYGINLLKDMKSVKVLMNELALLSFVIVNESSEIAYFMFDGEQNYQIYKYDALERENRNGTSTEIKSLISLLK